MNYQLSNLKVTIMKKIQFLGCLLLIIVMAACEKPNEVEEGIPTPSGQFIFEGKTYDLHHCSIRQNEWHLQTYEVLLYSYDKTVQMELCFINNKNGISTGNYQNFGTSVITSEQQLKAKISLCHILEDEPLSGDIYIVEFGKDTNGSYNLRVYRKDSPDEISVNWSGKLSA